ncbi:type VI secretion system ATPase TssH [Raoultella planticola]|uniref:type VI secretion system ATPase TssH n=1 Tax=Raoultella planticola TaxID=575 RepID=UPI00045A42E6|nr:type VI secretion system ATPase TssH [Raoultella planticola]KAJ93144.1 ATPase [Raoultella planticola]
MSFYLKQIVGKLTLSAKECLDSAINLAVSRKHFEVDTIHLIYSLIKHDAKLIDRLSTEALFQPSLVFNEINKQLEVFQRDNLSSPVFSESLVSLFEKSWLHASTKWSCSQLDVPALFAALLYADNALISDSVRHSLACDKACAENILLEACLGKNDINHKQDLFTSEQIDKYTTNLSKLAREGKIDPVIGRENEIRQLIDILLRRRQNNPVLTGDPGVGKTCIVEGLALRIQEGKVPFSLMNAEILTLDLTAILAGASVKGEFENRLQNLLKEISKEDKNIILFIDEAHMLIGSGGAPGQADAANLLKPALARGALRVIAATTWSEYKKYFEKDAALARRFQTIKICEPDTDTASAMVRALVPAMTHYHNVSITESAIKAATTLSSRYISGRKLPDKAVNLLDTACAHVSLSQVHTPMVIEGIYAELNRRLAELSALEEGDILRRQQLDDNVNKLNSRLALLEPAWKYQLDLVKKIRQCQDVNQLNLFRKDLHNSHRSVAPMVFERVDDTCIADVVSEWTGIPLGSVLETEKEKTQELLPRLQLRITGQDHALSAIASQIEICHANLNDPNKPYGVYLLAGPSGVGKTETAHALADLVYGGSNNLITVNMSEFQEAHSISGLKGSPPGYVGFGHGGTLTEGVRRNPYSVILLDEIEKAHHDVIELFYQVFDKGIMEDAEGQLINFRHALIIMTSNLASSQLLAAWDSGEKSMKNIEQLIRPVFDDFFKPAFMGRVNLIPFMPLTNISLKKIIKMKINNICRRVAEATNQMVSVKYKSSVVNWVMENCRHSQCGAREIDMILNSTILPLLAKQVCYTSGYNQQNECIELCVKNNQIVITSTPVGERVL